MFDGILIIDKPEGITSHDVVAKCRRILRTKKIGHTGTLDPFATGVVVVLVGKATRLAQFLDKDTKEYLATVKCGFETDTGDRTGELRITNYELRDVSSEEIETVLQEFRGEIMQTPPMYSAKKIDGKKLYELARKGIEIERKPVKINIYELELKEPFILHLSSFILRVSCSAGTYIRVLAEEIGKKLEIGAHLEELSRIRAGKFTLETALTLEELEEKIAENKIENYLISMNDAISHLPQMVLNEEETVLIKTGRKISARLDGESVQKIRLTDAQNNLIAIGICEDNIIQPRLVF